MKKTGIVVLASLLALILGITGCGSLSVGVIGGADGPTSIVISSEANGSETGSSVVEKIPETAEAPAAAEEVPAESAETPAASEEPAAAEEPAPAEEPAAPEEPAPAEQPAPENGQPGDVLTDEQAVTAVRNYCFSNQPDLEEIVKKGEYPVYWDISSSDENEVVVVYRSYTGALIRYYIDRATGDAYVTEFVPGIFTEEQRTDETLNVRDYLE